jgi:hypothetical protein
MQRIAATATPTSRRGARIAQSNAAPTPHAPTIPIVTLIG